MTVAESLWRAYLLRCGDGSLYAGVSNDVTARVAAHQCGRGARYTRARRPVTLVWRSPALDKRAAHRLEAGLKRLSRAEKLAIVNGGDGGLLRRLLRAARRQEGIDAPRRRTATRTLQSSAHR
jgi:putative endonuclease